MFKSKYISLFIFLISGLLLIVLAGCQGAVTEVETVFSTVETVEPVATTDISGIEAVDLENAISVGGVTWKIMNVNVLGPQIVDTQNYTFEAIRGKFVTVEFMVNNNSEDVRTLYDLNVIDNKGRVYTLCLPAYGFLATREKACSLVDLVPEIEYTFEAPFDISPDSEGLILEVTDLKLPVEEKAYIDLGY